MKAGGAYLPLVPGLPMRRLAVMIEASHAAVLVTHSSLLAGLPQHQLPVICIDRDVETLAQYPADDPLASRRACSIWSMCCLHRVRPANRRRSKSNIVRW